MLQTIVCLGLAFLSGTIGIQILMSANRNMKTGMSLENTNTKTGVRRQESVVYMADTEKNDVNLLWTEDKIYSLDYHYTKGYIYYSNYSAILRRNMNPSPKESAIEIAAAESVLGFSVDWVRDNVYWTWTDGNQGAMETADLDGRRRRTLFTNTDVRYLKGLSGVGVPVLYEVNIDPYERLLFVLATNSTHDFFVRSDLQGGQLKILIPTKNKTTISTFTIDYHKKRLYYTNEDDDIIVLYSCDYNGKVVQEIRTGETHKWETQIRVFSGSLYMVKPSGEDLDGWSFGTTHFRNTLYKMDLNSIKNDKGVMEQLMNISNTTRIKHMRLYDQDVQKSETEFCRHQCMRNDNCTQRRDHPGARNCDCRRRGLCLHSRNTRRDR